MSRVYINVHFAAIGALALLAVGFESTAGGAARAAWFPVSGHAIPTLAP